MWNESDDEGGNERDNSEIKKVLNEELEKRRVAKNVNYIAKKGSHLKDPSSSRIKGLDVSSREHILEKLVKHLSDNKCKFVSSGSSKIHILSVEEAASELEHSLYRSCKISSIYRSKAIRKFKEISVATSRTELFEAINSNPVAASSESSDTGFKTASASLEDLSNCDKSIGSGFKTASELIKSKELYKSEDLSKSISESEKIENVKKPESPKSYSSTLNNINRESELPKSLSSGIGFKRASELKNNIVVTPLKKMLYNSVSMIPDSETDKSMSELVIADYSESDYTVESKTPSRDNFDQTSKPQMRYNTVISEELPRERCSRDYADHRFTEPERHKEVAKKSSPDVKNEPSQSLVLNHKRKRDEYEGEKGKRQRLSEVFYEEDTTKIANRSQDEEASNKSQNSELSMSYASIIRSEKMTQLKKYQERKRKTAQNVIELLQPFYDKRKLTDKNLFKAIARALTSKLLKLDVMDNERLRRKIAIVCNDNTVWDDSIFVRINSIS